MSPEHPDAAVLRRTFAAFRAEPIAVGRAIATDAVWRVGGGSPMAGEYRGREEIFGFLRRTATLTGGTYSTELRYVLADDEHTVAVYRATGRRGDRSLDIDQALFCSLENGQLVDVTAVPFDQAAFDAFWAD
jgi:ketosteroid isomerase-like protein